VAAYVGEPSRFARFTRNKPGRFAYIAFACGPSRLILASPQKSRKSRSDELIAGCARAEVNGGHFIAEIWFS